MGRSHATSTPVSPLPKASKTSPGLAPPPGPLEMSSLPFSAAGLLRRRFIGPPVLRFQMQRFRLPGRDKVPVGVGGKRRAGNRGGKGGEGWVTMVWTRWSGEELRS